MTKGHINMSFDENFKQYLSKVKRIGENANDLAEEQTKNALIMPLFSLLGYDVFDTDEFMPEFICDVATKKGEKVDYAILKDGEPIIIIEVKRAGMKLQKQQQGQLFRYFSTNRCRVAILTNGITYQFFSDLNSPNVMDDEPFLSFNLLEDDPAIYIPSIKQFQKEKFDIKNVISKAVYQKYASVVEKTLKEDLLCPSDELVKYFLTRPEVKSGNRITSQMIEKHRSITQQAMQKVFGVKIQNLVSEKITVPDIKNSVESKSVSDNIEIVSDVLNDIKTESASDSNETVITGEAPPMSVQEISDKLQNILKFVIPNFSCIEEDTDDCLKLHIYTSDQRKIGNVRISKSDLSLQLKKIGNPTSYILKSAEDIKNYI